MCDFVDAGNGKECSDEKIKENDANCERITLLKGPPFAHELADIEKKFHTVAFDSVFRREKLANVKRRVPFHLTPPRTPSAEYAVAAASASSIPSPPSATQQGSALNRRPTMSGVLQN
ncbi:hypothetical protein EK21DRAFT_86760 [Setomelanomma holmii]|uniref:Uncharacterized protein n=1 Tax=Setomelanomma holmii TaxID=210430 RepID=A0A9P4HG84_9PLEO|nr:hypothetical protein EK21DRAFT_86760 [Setomelanomma holmii]